MKSACVGDLNVIGSLNADIQNVHVCLYHVDKKKAASTTKFEVSLGDDLFG